MIMNNPEHTRPLNPILKATMMLIMGFIISTSIGCASLEVGGGSGKSYAELEKMVKDKAEPKWEATDSAKLDDLGKLVVTGWAMDVYNKMQAIDKITKGSADYNQLLTLAYKDLPADASKEDREKAVNAELAKIKDKERRRKILETSKSVDSRQDELQKEIIKYLAQKDEVQEKLKAAVDEATGKFKDLGFLEKAKAVKPITAAQKSVQVNISYIQDCQQVNIWNRDAHAAIDAGGLE